ncbi:MAG: hypothetical protein JWN74_2057 [Acidobacteriaceae bacterium]|nr:hypothetical protein [Acidobacteriaceae bacterium]
MDSSLGLRLALALSAILGVAPNAATNAARIPAEVRFKSGYNDRIGKPADFTSAMLWGIAIADTRVPGFEKAQVEIVETQLSCRADGKEIILNDDRGNIRGGLYRRHPWFGTDVHDPIPLAYSDDHSTVILHVGERPDRIWHFWTASPRAALPSGHVDGCTVKIRARISAGALLQVGMDYWRNPTVGYGSGSNNHEAGASNWYFPSDQRQQATFTDIREEN